MRGPETCILRLPTDLKRRMERAARKDGLSLNQWALYNLSQSVAFTEAYAELQARLGRADMVAAKGTAWKILQRQTSTGPRPAWDTPPRGWKRFEQNLGLGVPAAQATRRQAGRPPRRRPSNQNLALTS